MTNQENESKTLERTTSDSEKCYVYYLGPSYNRGGTVKNISHATFQGMECIKGTAVRQRHWEDGRTVYIPIQHIGTLVEFDSFDELEKVRKAQKKHCSGILGRIVSKFKQN